MTTLIERHQELRKEKGPLKPSPETEALATFHKPSPETEALATFHKRLVEVEAKTNTVPAWVQPQGAHDAYPSGAKVTHVDKTWNNVHGDGNVWEPGVYGWEEVV